MFRHDSGFLRSIGKELEQEFSRNQSKWQDKYQEKIRALYGVYAMDLSKSLQATKACDKTDTQKKPAFLRSISKELEQEFSANKKTSDKSDT